MDYLRARQQMVESQLRTNQVTDHRVLSAFLSVPREEFVPVELRPIAYMDEDLVLPAAQGEPRALMELRVLGRLIHAARVAPGSLALVVGCGTGYSAAVLGRLAGSVIALESDTRLAEVAGEALSRADASNVAVVTGPLEEGWPDQAPYDLILLDGSVEFVPETLLGQLAAGGRLLAVVGLPPDGNAMLYERHGSDIGSLNLFDAFVHPLPGFRRAQSFVF